MLPGARRAPSGGVRAWPGSCGAPRRGRRRGAACGPAPTAAASGVSWLTPAPPCAWMALSMTHSRHRRRRDLDGLDLGVRALVADGVHQPGGLEHQQPGLLDAHPGLGDPVPDHALLGQRPAERDPARWPGGTSAPGPARPCRSAACSGGSGRARAGPGRWRSRRPRRRSGSPPGTRTSSKSISACPPCVAVVVAEDRHAADAPSTPGGVPRDQDHATAAGAGRPSGSVLPITMKISQSRVHRAGDPPLAAVDRRTRRRRARSGWRCWWRRRRRRPARSCRTPSGSRPSSSGFSQRSCCSGGAELGQHLHVAGVRRRAVERLRARAAGCAR